MTNPVSPRMSATEWGMLLVLSVLWGGSFFFAKIAVAELPPLTLVFGRVVLAALALHLVLLATGRPLPHGRTDWRDFAVMGLLNNLLPFSLIFWGQARIGIGLASILNATTPLFTAILAHLLTRDDRLTGGRVVGILLGIAGVVLLIGPEALAGVADHLTAELAILGAALSYGFAGIFGRRFRARGIQPIHSAAGQLTATSLMMLPIALVFDAPWRLAMPGLETWGALVALALLSTALAYILFFRILAGAGAANASLVTLLIPASAMVLGGVVLGERFGWNAYAGLGVILCGLLAADGRLAGRLLK